MIRKIVNLKLNNLDLFESDFKDVTKIIRNKKYQFRKSGNLISVRRLYKDFFDWIGGESLKLICVAEGKISSKKEEIEFRINLNPSYHKYLIIVGVILIGILTFLMSKNLILGISFGIMIIVSVLFSFFILKLRANQFFEELIEDIKSIN